MISRIASLDFLPCISTHSDSEFYIYDSILPDRSPESKEPLKRLPTACRVGTYQPNDFTVKNFSDNPIHLVAIDCCMYESGDSTRCDCALVLEQDIRFIEFSHGNFRRRVNRVEKCIPQLAATINDFYAQGIIPAGAVVQAIVCVGFTEDFPPRTATIDARTAQLNLLVKAPVAVELRVTDVTVFA